MIPIIATTLLAGCISGILLYFGKRCSLLYHKTSWDIALTIIRFVILLTFLYTVLQFHTSNSILLIILFVVSYIGTVLMLTTKAK